MPIGLIAGGAAQGIGAGATLGLSAAGLAAEQLIQHYIGLGRETADSWVKSGNGQDAFFHNVLEPASQISAEDPARAADLVSQGWAQYLEDANTFASQGKNQAKVIAQNMTTPAFMQTVASLLGENPLDPKFTSQVGNPGWLQTALSAVPTILQGIPLFRTPQVAGATTPVNPGTPTGTPPDQAPPDNSGATAGDIDPTTGLARVPTLKVDAPGSLPPDDTSSPPWSTIGTIGAVGGLAGLALGMGTQPLGPQPLPPTPQVPGVTAPVSPGTPTGTAPTSNSGQTPPAGSSLLSRLVPGLIGGGLSLLNGYLGANAANNAADTQSAAALKAAQLAADAGKYATDAQAKAAADALQFNRDALAQQQKNIQPWLDAGTGALKRIGDITTDPNYNWNQTYSQDPYVQPTEAEAMASPGIQFQMDQGRKALEAYEREHGTLLSGKAIKDIDAFSQGLASTGYNDVNSRNLAAYNTNAANKLAAYNTNYNSFSNERSATLNPQMALAGLGQTSTSQLNGQIGTAGTNAGNIGLNSATTIGNIAQNTAQQVANQNTNAAAARASGYVGAGNSYTTAIGQVGNNLLDGYYASKYFK